MMKRFALVVVLLSLSMPAGASANEVHEGFFLRLQLGLGAVNTSAEDLGRKIGYGGTAGEFSVGIGGAIAPNLVLFGEIVSHSAPSPYFEVDGVKNPSTIEVDGSLYETMGPKSLGLVGIGPGISYYFMPINIFVSGSINLTTVTLKRQDGLTFESDIGAMARFTLGKEWWVADGVGLGLGATASAGTIQDATTMAFGLGGSLTFN